MSVNTKGYTALSPVGLNNEMASTSPSDRALGAYFIFVLLGIGGMFPWNAFLTAFDYFSNMFCDFPFQFIMSIVFNVATVATQFLGLAIGERISLTVRVMLTFVPMLISMMLIPFTVYFFEATTPRLLFTLAFVFLSGFSTAMGFNAVIGLASQFPPEYVGAVMTGQGIAGVAVGVLAMVTKAAVPHDGPGIIKSTLIYFLCAAFVEALCIIMYFVLIRLPFSRHHMAKQDRAASTASETEKLLQNPDMERLVGRPSISSVFKKVALQAFSVWSVFFVTLSLFPGMTSVIPAFGNTWFPVINIFLFQLFDFVGRMLPRWLRLVRPRLLWLFSVARVAFGALFLMCILPGTPAPLFNSPAAGMVIMAFFAVTNGYFGTLAMMYGPDCVEDSEKSTAGRIMSVALQLGIFSAVLFALFILYFVARCQMPSFLLFGEDYKVCVLAVNITNSTCIALK